MKVSVRRIGNSLGVILPKTTLDAWGVGEGDELELTERALRPAVRGGFSHQELDELRWSISLAVIRRCTPREIRAKSLANLHRWKQQEAWVSAFDEWKEILKSEDDGGLYAAMLGRDENAVRLRQSMPYVGLGRLVNLSPGDTGGVKGLCLEPHDLAIANYAASREKDLIFNRELARRGLLSESRCYRCSIKLPSARTRVSESAAK